MAGIEDTYRHIAELARKHGARRVVLFGSRGRGDAFFKSDIDIAVEGCADFDAFKEDLDENLWSLLEVDAVNLDGCISKDLAKDIERDGKVLYEAV